MINVINPYLNYIKLTLMSYSPKIDQDWKYLLGP